MLLMNLGRLDEAERTLERTLAAQRRTLGQRSDDAGITRFSLALLAARRGQEPHAVELVDEALRSPLLGLSVEAIESNLAPLRNDPRYDAARKRLRSDKRFAAHADQAAAK